MKESSTTLDLLGRGWVGSVIDLVGIALGIAGILAGYVFYRRSRIGPRLAYHQRFERLIGSGNPTLPEEVEIYFAGKKVQRLTKTVLAIWNYGSSTTHGSSVVDDDPVRFVFPQTALVLKPRVIATTRKANKLTARLRPDSPNEVICEFDYLDAKDGGVIEVLHTGENGTATVLGAVRGIPTGLEDLGSAEHFRSLHQWWYPFFIIFLILGVTYEVAERVYYFFPIWPFFALIGLIIVVSLWVVGVRMLWGMRSRYPRQLRKHFELREKGDKSKAPG